MEIIDAKLDEVIKRLDYVETLLLIGEEYPDHEEIDAINEYFLRKKSGDTKFISVEEIDNEL